MNSNSSQQNLNNQIILASASRDRKRCFEAAGIPIDVFPSNFDEDTIPLTDPYQYVQDLAFHKALTVKKSLDLKKSHASVIIGADTMVIDGGKMIGKAKNVQDAFNILSTLIGKTHEIITGVCVLSVKSDQQTQFVSSSQVHFQALTPDEIWDYLNVTNEFQGRAGAYSMFERASLFIDSIHGSPTNVLGIPMAHLRTVLKEFNINLLNPSK